MQTFLIMEESIQFSEFFQKLNSIYLPLANCRFCFNGSLNCFSPLSVLQTLNQEIWRIKHEYSKNSLKTLTATLNVKIWQKQWSISVSTRSSSFSSFTNEGYRCDVHNIPVKCSIFRWSDQLLMISISQYDFLHTWASFL